MLYYFNNEPAKLAAVLAEVGPVVQAGGGLPEKQFLTALLRCQLVQRRHRVDEEIIATARAALAAAEEGGRQPLLIPLPEPQRGDHEIGWSQYNLGRCLVLHGGLDEAGETLSAALATADRMGEEVLRVRALSLLALAALRRHDAVAVAGLVHRVLEAPALTQWPEYLAMAKASLAWLVWREGAASRR